VQRTSPLHTANTTIKACPERVSEINRLCTNKPYRRVMRNPPPDTNHYVGSAWPELVTNSVPCKIQKSADHCNRTYH